MGGFRHARLTGGCLAALLLSASPGAPQASRGSDVAQPTAFVPGSMTDRRGEHLNICCREHLACRSISKTL